MTFHLTSWITIAALALFFWTTVQVAIARKKFAVIAPASEGPPDFAKVMRVQINTLEQLVLFLPALWLCALWLGDQWAAAAGAVWVAGRIIYALAYYRDASKRGLGYTIGMSAWAALLVGAAVGLIR